MLCVLMYVCINIVMYVCNVMYTALILIFLEIRNVVETARTYVFSSPTIQMADSSFTTSVIMADWLGSMALASSARLFSSPRIRSKPYCSKHKPRPDVVIFFCNKIKQTCETIKSDHM